MQADSNTTNENRAAIRYPVSFLVEFDDGEGWTRDVSTTGVCIITDRPFDSGASIRFVLHQKDLWDDVTKLRCRGNVVRTEPVGNKWKIAVFMEEFCFE